MSSERKSVAVLATSLLVFAAIAYGPDLRLPFVGDDYVFLDETLHATFASLWSRQHTAFDWYRPWSREFHFWSLLKIAGASPGLFRLVSLGLWVAVLVLYAQFLSRFVPKGAALLASIGLASLAMWGTPLLWISGGQDLWMLLFGMLFLLCVADERPVLAVLTLVLALLSKETAATLPLVALGYSAIIHKRPLARAALRTLPYAGVTLVWFLLHPTLRGRLFVHAEDPETLARPGAALIGLKNLLATVNLSLLPAPFEVTVGDAVRALASAAVLGVACFHVLAIGNTEAAKHEPSRGRAALFAAVWAIVGWVPTHLPSISWHAYYGCVGALGAWTLIASWLVNLRRLATVVVVCLALIRAADAKTLSWDWGNEWYLRRAGNLLGVIERNLKARHPQLPSHSRVYFGRIPNNIGLVAGQSAAVRIWYADSTLTADFFSSYRPRVTRGRDYFFRFDSVSGVVEVVAGAEDVRLGRAENPDWSEDHVKLAVLFLRAGDLQRAAKEFEKVGQVSGQEGQLLYAAVCRRLIGQVDAADSLLATFRMRSGLSAEEVNLLVRRLEESAPPIEGQGQIGH